MRLLTRKEKNDSSGPSTPRGGGVNNGSGTAITSKSERGGVKGRSSLTKLLHGIDRSYHGSKFLGKKGRDLTETLADSHQGPGLFLKAEANPYKTDDDDGAETSQKRGDGAEADFDALWNGTENDTDDMDEPEDCRPKSSKNGNKAKSDKKESKTRSEEGERERDRDRDREKDRERRSSRKSRDVGADNDDPSRKPRESKSRDRPDALERSRHGNKQRASTGDLSRSRHGKNVVSRKSANSVEDILRKKEPMFEIPELGERKETSRPGGAATSRAEKVVDALRKSRHGGRRPDDGEDILAKPSGRDDALRKSRHGSDDALRKSRHGSSSLSKSRHGGSSVSKPRSASHLSKSRHGNSQTRSRQGREDSRNAGQEERNKSPQTHEHPDDQNEKDALVSLCCVCGEPARTYLQALNKKYHHACFNCVGCHEPIDPTAPFTYMSEEGEKHPLHMSCHSELYSMKCTVCSNFIPAGADGKIKYSKHPFFSNEVMCPSHVVEADSSMGGAQKPPVRRCTSCHRFEPLKGKGFLDLGDVDRCVCMACCRTIVCDSVDAQPIWRKVIKFWEKNLNLPVWEGMKEVPILIVGSDVISEQVTNLATDGQTYHSVTAKGLCLSEKQATDLPSFVTEDGKPLPASKSPELTAILCLTGLPSDLTASVLAHEAMHAWFKLHPEFGASNRVIPCDVEEGCAQLIAYLYLCEREATAKVPEKGKSRNEDGPSDEKLRQYFKYTIESDSTEIFGDGFRRASQAYSEVGIEMLLNHVAYYGVFPEV